VPVTVEALAGGDSFDITCADCGAVDRMHPVEPWVAQMFIFLGQHRHSRD
jgi:hypothetical protein